MLANLRGSFFYMRSSDSSKSVHATFQDDRDKDDFSVAQLFVPAEDLRLGNTLLLYCNISAVFGRTYTAYA